MAFKPIDASTSRFIDSNTIGQFTYHVRISSLEEYASGMVCKTWHNTQSISMPNRGLERV